MSMFKFREGIFDLLRDQVGAVNRSSFDRPDQFILNSLLHIYVTQSATGELLIGKIVLEGGRSLI